MVRRLWLRPKAINRPGSSIWYQRELENKRVLNVISTNHHFRSWAFSIFAQYRKLGWQRRMFSYTHNDRLGNPPSIEGPFGRRTSQFGTVWTSPKRFVSWITFWQFSYSLSSSPLVTGWTGRAPGFPSGRLHGCYGQRWNSVSNKPDGDERHTPYCSTYFDSSYHR